MRVKLLLTSSPIVKGDEITISYILEKSAPVAMIMLQSKWVIFCDADCACKDASRATQIARVEELDEQAARQLQNGKATESQRSVKALLVLEETLKTASLSGLHRPDALRRILGRNCDRQSFRCRIVCQAGLSVVGSKLWPSVRGSATLQTSGGESEAA
jgi:hypothetical protein